MDNPFVLPVDEYKRDINVIKHYLEQSALFLSKHTGESIDRCREAVRTRLSKEGKFAFQDKKITFLERDETGDRTLTEGTLYGYLKKVETDGTILAPTFTVYQRPDIEESYLVKFVDTRVAGRKVLKKLKFEAKMAGDKLKEDIYDSGQNNKKTSNNSLSGAQESKYTPVHNKTAHPSLTSTCRITSGYGNANNEKMLCGNRHYRTYDVTLSNLVSIIQLANIPLIEEAVEKYQLTIPTVDDVIKCIEYSSNKYWRNRDQMGRIKLFIEKLSSAERCAIVYTGDLYHLRVFNDAMMRELFTKMSSKIESNDPIENPDIAVDSTTEEIRTFCKYIFSATLAGKELRSLKDTPFYHNYARTVLNIEKVIQEYAILIKAFFVSQSVPAAVGYFPESVRHAALTSDTDSTIFTVEDWVIWYFGENRFGEAADAIYATAVFFASETIIHLLAMMSANLGVEKKRLFQIAMKNEYKFDIFIPTNVAKHYYALQHSQEGNIFNKYVDEIKGVHLKSSQTPPAVNKVSKELMKYVLTTVQSGKKVSLTHVLGRTAWVENEILRDIKRGGTTYFKWMQVKEKTSYAQDEYTSNFRHYHFWNEVFGPKYGMVDEPPFTCSMVKTNLTNSTRIRSWLEEMEDKEIAKRVINWMDTYKKNAFGTICVPMTIIEKSGIPDEIMIAIERRGLVRNDCNTIYLILETLGYYVVPEKGNHVELVSDFYSEIPPQN